MKRRKIKQINAIAHNLPLRLFAKGVKKQNQAIFSLFGRIKAAFLKTEKQVIIPSNTNWLTVVTSSVVCFQAKATKITTTKLGNYNYPE